MANLKSKIKSVCGIAAILIILATPILGFAQGSAPYQAAEGLKQVFPSTGFSIQNPLKYGTISALLKGISGYLISLGAGVATLMVLWGAFQILTAGGGDSKGYEKGKDTIMYAAIGLAILLLAGGIGSLVSDILGGGTSSSPSPTGGGYSTGAYAPTPTPTNPYGYNVYGSGDLLPPPETLRREQVKALPEPVRVQ